MKNSRPTMLVIAFLAAVLIGLATLVEAQTESAATTHYTVINLGTLGGTESNGYGGVNDKGWVTGDANLSGDQNEHAFLWREGVMTDLGTLGGLNSSVGFPVKNNTGLIIGSAQTSTVDPLGEYWGASYICTPSGPCQGYQNLNLGFLWQSSVMTPLRTLGGNNGSAFGVNNGGQVVGMAETATYDQSCIPPQRLDFDAVIWGPKEGEIQELPAFPGDSIAVALAINDKGQVVGTSGICEVPDTFALGVHAVLWQNGSVTNLGSFGGVMNNAALAINYAGQVVGISDLPGDTTTHAFLWQNGAMTDLGTLPGDFLSIANDINDKGQVVGLSCDVNFNCRAFLWQNGVMTDLNTLIPPDSSLYLVYGASINSESEITGTAFDQTTGDAPAFLAVPAAGSQGSHPSPKVTLPENVRKLLQQRSVFGRFALR